jgi:hypothetical protein
MCVEQTPTLLANIPLERTNKFPSELYPYGNNNCTSKGVPLKSNNAYKPGL